eukprot:TRINITY_DN6803_c0_g1_i2.p1 TRINITY_DN6803_c0_g1~~TRINITY_DN6803_c0_g1_i2.p1  ORF type:complete len:196 (-),score=28.15 TRINITY_DN6803_c0_g1_i2:171-725(-)
MDLMKSTSIAEERFADTFSENIWTVVSPQQKVIHEIAKDNWKLQLTALVMGHTMAQKISVLRKLERLRSTETILQRQSFIERVISSNSSQKCAAELVRLSDLMHKINAEVLTARSSMDDMTKEAEELRTKLRTLKHVQTIEASALRDHLLMRIHDLDDRNTGLAQLHREQLQIVACFADVSRDM